MLRDRYGDALRRRATLHPAAAQLPVTSFMPILLASPAAAEKLLQALATERVEARRWFRPALPAHPAFRGLRTLTGARCVNAERLAECIVCLPFHARLEPRAVSRVGEVVAETLAACAAR
jgi:dTDP-4-amino-4,6-dideoxygalactose transaminase